MLSFAPDNVQPLRFHLPKHVFPHNLKDGVVIKKVAMMYKEVEGSSPGDIDISLKTKQGAGNPPLPFELKDPLTPMILPRY